MQPINHKQNRMQIFKILGAIIGGILVVDLIGFVAWLMSGQIPADGYYFGQITATIIKIII